LISSTRGLDEKAKLDDKDPRKPIVDAARYLRNNRSRMDYPRYRRLGLPVTSAWMESLVKEVNYRVKGTEMFWNDPEAAIFRGLLICPTLGWPPVLPGRLVRPPL
jgi:hypothetical protein